MGRRNDSKRSEGIEHGDHPPEVQEKSSNERPGDIAPEPVCEAQVQLPQASSCKNMESEKHKDNESALLEVQHQKPCKKPRGDSAPMAAVTVGSCIRRTRTPLSESGSVRKRARRMSCHFSEGEIETLVEAVEQVGIGR